MNTAIRLFLLIMVTFLSFQVSALKDRVAYLEDDNGIIYFNDIPLYPRYLQVIDEYGNDHKSYTPVYVTAETGQYLDDRMQVERINLLKFLETFKIDDAFIPQLKDPIVEWVTDESSCGIDKPCWNVSEDLTYE